MQIGEELPKKDEPMAYIIIYLREYFPGTTGFFRDFFNGMNNGPIGHSLKKWLAVGIFWIIAYEVMENTSEENLVDVLLILVPALLALVGIYTVANHKEKKLVIDQQPKNETTTDKPS
jgi:hypothetical protein